MPESRSMTEQRVLPNGDKATLVRGINVTDASTLHGLIGDKLTISDHITLDQDEYFIVDVTGTVFKYALAIDLTSSPTDKVMSGEKALSQLNAEDAKLVLKVYDLFKKS